MTSFRHAAGSGTPASRGGRGRALGLAGVAVVALSIPPGGEARARPVRTGTFVEIPYGISPAHPAAAAGVTARRAGASRLPGPGAEPVLRWVANLPHRVQDPPVIASWGHLYVPHGHEVAAIDGTGAVLWSIPVGPLGTAPALTPGRGLVVAPASGPVTFLDAFGGGVRRRAPAGQGARVAPAVLPDGSVVVASRARRLSRVDAAGELVFTATLPEPPSGPVAVGRGPRLVVPGVSSVSFYDLGGHRERSVELPGPAKDGVAVGPDGTVVVATSGEPTVLAWTPTGRLRWRRSLPAPPASRPVIADDGSVRVAVTDGSLVCLGPTGIPRWRTEHEGLLHLVVDVTGATFAVDVLGALSAFEPDGRLRFETPSLDVPRGRRSVPGPPVLGRDETVLVAVDRTLRAYGPR